ncbi:MAG: serine O-acetyltransferase [Solirubrobacteraceae bacterium]
MKGLGRLRRQFGRLWLFSPERLWALSRALHRRGHWVLAFWVKQLNTVLYHNSLSPEAIVGTNVLLGHYSHGVVVNSNVEIGDGVKIWHNVTLTAGRPPRRDGKPVEGGPAARIVIEDGVKIGTNAVVVAPRGRCLRIGRFARLGAGVIVTQDVPARATVVSAPARVLLKEGTNGGAEVESGDADIRFAEGDRGSSAHPPQGPQADAPRSESTSQP